MAYVLIKERSGDPAVIRTNCYGSSLAFLEELFAEAKKDFPDLQSCDVVVRYYGGPSYSRTFGLEFAAPSEFPDGYCKSELLPTT